MKISFGSKKLQKTIEDGKRLQKAYGKQQALKITQRISELFSAETLNDILYIPSARLHKLTGGKKGKLAIDIIHPFRIIIEPVNGDLLNYKTINEIEIIDIKDYH